MATTDNFLRGGDLSLKLQPSSESLAGSAVACCALLTSSDEGLPARYGQVRLPVGHRLHAGLLAQNRCPSALAKIRKASKCCRMYDVEHVESLGQDVVLVAVPMITSRPYTSSSGTAFPGYPVLGALLVAMDRDSATHPRSASQGDPTCGCASWKRKMALILKPAPQQGLAGQLDHRQARSSIVHVSESTVTLDGVSMTMPLGSQGAHGCVLLGRDTGASGRATYKALGRPAARLCAQRQQHGIHHHCRAHCLSREAI